VPAASKPSKICSFIIINILQTNKTYRYSVSPAARAQKEKLNTVTAAKKQAPTNLLWKLVRSHTISSQIELVNSFLLNFMSL
jgi:arginine repressor